MKRCLTSLEENAKCKIGLLFIYMRTAKFKNLIMCNIGKDVKKLSYPADGTVDRHNNHGESSLPIFCSME